MPLGDIAGLFGKSLRTISSLNNRYRQDFFEAEDEVALRREAVGIVERGAQTQDEVIEQLTREHTALEVERAIEDVVRSGYLERVGDRLTRALTLPNSLCVSISWLRWGL